MCGPRPGARRPSAGVRWRFDAAGVSVPATIPGVVPPLKSGIVGQKQMDAL